MSLLICEGKDYVEGIENVYKRIKGSCSMLLLTAEGIIGGPGQVLDVHRS